MRISNLCFALTFLVFFAASCKGLRPVAPKARDVSRASASALLGSINDLAIFRSSDGTSFKLHFQTRNLSSCQVGVSKDNVPTFKPCQTSQPNRVFTEEISGLEPSTLYNVFLELKLDDSSDTKRFSFKEIKNHCNGNHKLHVLVTPDSKLALLQCRPSLLDTLTTTSQAAEKGCAPLKLDIFGDQVPLAIPNGDAAFLTLEGFAEGSTRLSSESSSKALVSINEASTRQGFSLIRGHEFSSLTTEVSWVGRRFSLVNTPLDITDYSMTLDTVLTASKRGQSTLDGQELTWRESGQFPRYTVLDYLGLETGEVQRCLVKDSDTKLQLSSVFKDTTSKTSLMTIFDGYAVKSDDGLELHLVRPIPVKLSR